MSTKRALSTAHSFVDSCRDRLADVASNLEELARRRRPPERLELEDLLDAVEAADELAKYAFMFLDDGLEELQAGRGAE